MSGWECFQNTLWGVSLSLSNIQDTGILFNFDSNRGKQMRVSGNASKYIVGAAYLATLCALKLAHLLIFINSLMLSN
jgi:hypothetical protein